MAFKLDEKVVLGAFDRLAVLGVIHYGPSEVVRLADKEFTVLQCKATFEHFLTHIPVRIPHMSGLVSEANDSRCRICSHSG